MKQLRPSITLLIVTIFTYGLLIHQLGFYWDDLPITWIRYQLGSDALTSYFSTNRPVWGLLHQITTRMIPQTPVYWQIFALTWKWIGALLVYAIIIRLWKSERSALGVALLFLVYPAFNQHWAAYLYSHFYIVLSFFLFSFLCMLIAAEIPTRYWAWTIAGMIFSALNLWMMEYFYVLELARIGVILLMTRAESWSLRERATHALKSWTPYLMMFILAVLSRIFIFNNQVYGMGLTSQLKSAPIETIKTLAQTMWLSLRLVLKDAWQPAFELQTMSESLGIILGVVIVATLGYMFLPRTIARSMHENLANALWMIGLGALMVLLAGVPFWLISFTPSLAWPASRFTLPFLLGASLIFYGILELIPWDKLRIVILVVLVGLAAGKQYRTSQEYARDWAVQKELFWQLTWRAPGIKPGTLILLNEGALKYYADNSLSPALNWIYAPDNHSNRVDYVLFYPTTRLRNALPELKTDIPIYYDYLAGEFHGNTSQTLALYYEPPGCLRILDPEIEGANHLIRETSLMRFAAHISDPRLILNEPQARMPEMYGPEPEHDFCYYFEQADLARQFADWDAVASFSERALSFDTHVYHPAEQLVFIEGYAHTGKWERALELSRGVYEASPDAMGRTLCQLWKRIGAETGSSVERSEALSKIRDMVSCDL